MPSQTFPQPELLERTPVVEVREASHPELMEMLHVFARKRNLTSNVLRRSFPADRKVNGAEQRRLCTVDWCSQRLQGAKEGVETSQPQWRSGLKQQLST